MRVVHIAPFYYPVIGGVEEVAKKLAEYVAHKGNETYVLTYNRLRKSGAGCLPKEEIINDVRVIRLDPNLTWSYGTYSTKLPQTLRRLRPDLVHVHVWRHPHVFQAAKLRQRMNFKAVLHGHAPFLAFSQVGVATWLYHRTIDCLEKKTLSRYDIMLALTPHEERILVKKLGVPQEKVEVVPNGIDDELANSSGLGTTTAHPTVLYLGRISRQKNVRLLVKAMQHVRTEKPAAKLVMAGPDEGLVPTLRGHSDTGSVNFQYLGMVSESEKLELYRECNVFTNPAIYEPYGITLLEAQAFGKPCVITGRGGQEYATQPGKTSLHAEPYPEDFANVISTLLNDEDLYKRLSLNARKWASQHTWSKILPTYDAIYS